LFSLNSGYLSSWICGALFEMTHKKYLVVIINAQNSIVLGGVVLKYFAHCSKMPVHAQNVFGGFNPLLGKKK